MRAFIGTVGITRRWIKNFAEIARPLARLTGKVEWRWTQAEQLSFEILRIKCATQSGMHGIDMTLVVHFYTDASGFGAGFAITQFQKVEGSEKPVEVPALYDSFPFSATQRNYPTYKRELCTLVTFCRKYNYLCKHPYLPTVVHTDHKPLTHFLKSDLHEGIYGHWADVLRRLNLTISYIPGPRNKVADGLSRTLFNSQCSETTAVARVQAELERNSSQWIWKDGKDGFESFLAKLTERDRCEVINEGTLYGVSAFSLEAVASAMTAEETLSTWKEAYCSSEWFGDIYKFLDDTYASEVSAKLMQKAFDYRICGDILWISRRGECMPCVPESKVLQVLEDAHDKSGHWAKAGTLARLRGCYWPGQSQDVERYIAGCISCARHGPATRSQPLHPVVVTYPFQLMGMDFIGPLETTGSGSKYILNLICYMSRFDIPFATKTANVEDVIWCLRLFFAMYRKPYAFYFDSGQHFDNEELREFLKSEGISYDYSPSGSSKSTGMVEVANKLVEDVLRKPPPAQAGMDWDLRLPKSAQSVNSRIISYLGYSPTGILFGPAQETSATTATLLALPGRDIHQWVAELGDPAQYIEIVRKYISYRAETQDIVSEASKRQKEEIAIRYNRSITQTVHEIGSLVMLYQKDTGKLQARWRGPFRISGYGGSHGLSFTLKQLNDRRIRGTFHGDHLKRFIPRTGYLAEHGIPLPPLPPSQNIRHPRQKAR